MLEIHTPIPTPTGWTTAGDARLNDLVLGPNGITKVTNSVKTVLYEEFGFEVAFADSNSVICGQSQPWLLHDGTVLSATSLRAEFQSRSDKGQTRSLRVRNPLPLELPPVYDTYSPYHIGKVVGTKKNVPIPHTHRRGTLEQRKELLKGLMDAGGTYNPSRRRCSFILRHPETADSVLELLVSFGFTPQLTPADGAFRIEWTPPFNPFSSKPGVECRTTENSKLRTIIAVRLVRNRPMVRLETASTLVLAGPLMVPIPATSKG